MSKLPLNLQVLQAVDSAAECFWDRIFTMLSDGDGPGDFPPLLEITLHRAMVQAVNTWVKLNIDEDYVP